MAQLEEKRPAAVGIIPRLAPGKSAGVAAYPIAQAERSTAVPAGRVRPAVEDEIAAVPSTASVVPRSPVVLAALQILLDALMIIAAFALAYRLRFEEDILPVKDPPKPEAYIF